jgi:hypothetical protein
LEIPVERLDDQIESGDTNMRTPIKPSLWMPLLLCSSILNIALPLARCTDVPDKQQIIKKARAAYYSLRSHGLDGFEASVQPNWRLVLKDQLAQNPAGAEEALKMLNGIHFQVSLGRDGAVKIAHHEDIAPVNQQAAEGFKQIFGGMDQAMSGFFDSWSIFMLTSPFPVATGDYTLEELNHQYHLSYKDGAAAISTTMTQDLVITEIKVDSPEFKSVLKPQFTKSAEGLLLSQYDATYQGTGSGDSTILNVRIENQPVNGFQLARKLNLDGSYQGTPFQMELMFGNYQVKGH